MLDELARCEQVLDDFETGHDIECALVSGAELFDRLLYHFEPALATRRREVRSGLDGDDACKHSTRFHFRAERAEARTHLQ